MTRTNLDRYHASMTEAQMEKAIRDAVYDGSKNPVLTRVFGIMGATQQGGRSGAGTPSGVAERRRRSTSVATLSRKSIYDKSVPLPGRFATTCATCGAQLHLRQSRLKINSTGRFFCNRACSHAFRLPLEGLFSANIEKLENGCWRYRGGETKHGYRNINLTGRGRGWVGAHRVSYELHKGPIPEGLVIDHLCRNRSCVNPDHLEAVTFDENVRRAVSYPVADRCSRGHLRTPENTVYRSNGNIHSCLECQRERRAARAK